MASFFHVPAFDDKRSRYDMHTFKGRAWKFYRDCNPALMFETEKSIDLHKQRLAEFTRTVKTAGKQRDAVPYSDNDLWYSRSVIEGCVHPTTNKTILAPCRFASYAPINLALVPLMLAPSVIASKTRSVGVHAINQTVNAVVNYANASGEDLSVERLGAAYAAAVVTSCTFAFGASVIMGRLGSAPSIKATLVRATLPFTACCSAGCANLALMRIDEWTGKGVPVRAAQGPLGSPINDDNAGEVLGFSLQAGREGVGMCALSRIFLNVCVMSMPPVIMGIVGRNAFVKRNPATVGKPLDFIVTGGLTLICVPLCLALQTPVVTMPVTQLEESFHNLSDRKTGKPIEYVTFYKGL